MRAGSITELEQLLELARAAAARRSPAAPRLAYEIEQNIRFLRLSRPTPAPAVPPPPVMPPAPEVPAAPIWPPPAAPAARATPAPQQPRPQQQPPAQPRPPREPRFTLPKLEPSDLLGARALAVAGGVVMLLGIVFFFVLAVNRGWVGPAGRVALGGGAALFVFAGGLELRRRYGDTYSSLAAVGTGIAGGYATLLSAAALYDLIPDYAALAIAAAIAAVAVATSIAWRSQLVAGFGLIGAMLVPPRGRRAGRIEPARDGIRRGRLRRDGGRRGLDAVARPARRRCPGERSADRGARVPAGVLRAVAVADRRARGRVLAPLRLRGRRQPSARGPRGRRCADDFARLRRRSPRGDIHGAALRHAERRRLRAAGDRRRLRTRSRALLRAQGDEGSERAPRGGGIHARRVRGRRPVRRPAARVRLGRRGRGRRVARAAGARDPLPDLVGDLSPAHARARADPRRAAEPPLRRVGASRKRRAHRRRVRGRSVRVRVLRAAVAGGAGPLRRRVQVLRRFLRARPRTAARAAQRCAVERRDPGDLCRLARRAGSLLELRLGLGGGHRAVEPRRTWSRRREPAARVGGAADRRISCGLLRSAQR